MKRRRIHRCSGSTLSKPPEQRTSTTIVTGLSSCDPVRRTAGERSSSREEAGATGGFYELIDPHAHQRRDQGDSTAPPGRTATCSISASARRSAACRSKASRFKSDGTMIYGDELAPSGGSRRRRHLQVRPDSALSAAAVRSDAGSVAAGRRARIYGLRVAASGSTNWGQGAETGKGTWIGRQPGRRRTSSIDSGNVILRTAQVLQKFTGYYRPEDMDIDPIAAENARVPRLLGQHRPQAATPTAAWSRTAASTAKSCASSRTRRAPPCPRRRPERSRRSSASSPAARSGACMTTSPSSRTPAISSSSRTAA